MKSRDYRIGICAALFFLLFLGFQIQYQGDPKGDRMAPDRAPRASVPVDSDDPEIASAGEVSSASVSDPNSVSEKVGLGGFPEGPGWEKARVVRSEYYLPYFEKKKQLEILTNRVAVFSKVGTDNPGQSPLSALAEEGFREEDAEEHAIAGWRIAQTRNALGINDGPNAVARIAELVRSISTNSENAAFSSPVFRDPDLGGLLVATPVILMGFREDSSNGEKQASLDSIPEIRDAVSKGNMDLSDPYLKIPVPFAENAFRVFDLVNALASQPAVLFAEPDMIFEGVGQLLPNDPEFDICWGLRNTGQSSGQVDFDMDADEAWDITTGNDSVKVLIIDTGVQQNHPDINQETGKDFTSESSSSPNGDPVNQYDNHGTPVAGAVSAIINNSTGAVGVAPGVKSVSARCFISTNSSGSWTATYSWTADALTWARGEGIRVTNNSNLYGGTSSAVEAAYSTSKTNNSVHFACAGNNGSGSLGYPARVSTVHGIAASDRNGGKASFSQYGTGLAFIAPGASIRLPDRTGAAGYNSTDLATVNGTSFASPYTAGIAALMLSVNPVLNGPQIDDILETTSTDLGISGYDTLYGWGHVNALAAVTAAQELVDDAYEENDTRATAYDLSSLDGEWLDTLSGLGKQSDDDWFQISAPGGNTRITVDCDFAHSGGNIDIALHDSSGAVIATSATATDNENIDLLVPASGTFFVRVYGSGSKNTYNLQWRHRPPPYLTLSSPDSEVPPNAGGSDFTISSNDSWSWSLEGGNGWLFISEASPQTGDQTFSFAVGNNTVVESRSATLTFENGYQSVTHTITQEGVPPTLDLSDAEQSFGPNGGPHNFAVTSNTVWTWTASSGGEHISSGEASPQNQNQIFSYTLSANPGIEHRQVILEFTNGTQTRTHTVSQTGVLPGLISGLSAAEDDGNGIGLMWSDAAFATAYQVWRGDAPAFHSMELLGTVSETAFTDTAVESGKNYYYRIVSENQNGVSESSSEADGKLFGILDAMALRPGSSAIYGNNIFNTLAGQAVSYKTKKRGASKYQIILENESDQGSEIVAASSRKGNRKFNVTYLSSYASGGNVTATITTGRHLARSYVNRSEVVTVVVKPTKTARKKSGGISLFARAWLHERPATSDFVSLRHKKLKK